MSQLCDIAVFFVNFRDLYEGFQERHSAVEQIFRDKETAFLIVCAPHDPALEVANFFLNELKNRDMHTPAVIANQCHIAKFDSLNPQEHLSDDASKLMQDLVAHTDSTLLARMRTAHKRLRNLCKEEESLLQKLRSSLQPHQHLFRIPRFHGEVHDIRSLNKVGQALLNQDHLGKKC